MSIYPPYTPHYNKRKRIIRKERRYPKMYFKTAICDDNITEINILTNYLKQYEIEYDIEFKTDLYSSADALIEKYISVGMYDLLFLDVEMPGKNGLDAASIIRQRGDRDVRIIFVSNYPEYMQDSFNVQAFHYLSKPLSYECLLFLSYTV